MFQSAENSTESSFGFRMIRFDDVTSGDVTNDDSYYNDDGSRNNNNMSGVVADDAFGVLITPFEVVAMAFMTLITVGIVVGNCFVVVSVVIFSKMRTLSNALIASLASADLLVAVAVLPFSLLYELFDQWTFGSALCDLWITSDVFCCTASILNIVVIAIDRYWLITKNVRYTHSSVLPRRRVCLMMLTLAWTLSGVISCLPLFGWRTGMENADPTQCLISQDYGYTIFSTFGAFWFPLCVILVVYCKIFFFARQRAMRRAAKPILPDPEPIQADQTEVVSPSRKRSMPFRKSSKCRDRMGSISPPESTSMTVTQMKTSGENKTTRQRTNRSRRIRRSARTLGLIIGGFLVCWLPFFIVATVVPFCDRCKVPDVVSSLVLWLGYSNSLFNPAIYAIWDKNFRRAFKRLSTCNLRWDSQPETYDETSQLQPSMRLATCNLYDKTSHLQPTYDETRRLQTWMRLATCNPRWEWNSSLATYDDSHLSHAYGLEEICEESSRVSSRRHQNTCFSSSIQIEALVPSVECIRTVNPFKIGTLMGNIDEEPRWVTKMGIRYG